MGTHPEDGIGAKSLTAKHEKPVKRLSHRRIKKNEGKFEGDNKATEGN